MEEKEINENTEIAEVEDGILNATDGAEAPVEGEEFSEESEENLPEESEESLSEELSEEDYENDVDELSTTFPELAALSDVSELPSAKRYLELRALGLSCEEAYLATAKRTVAKDTRSHIVSTVPKGAVAPSCGMNQRELRAAREIFAGMSDTEIRALYNKVTK